MGSSGSGDACIGSVSGTCSSNFVGGGMIGSGAVYGRRILFGGGSSGGADGSVHLGHDQV